MVDAPVLDKDRNNGGESVGGNGGGSGGDSGGGSAVCYRNRHPLPPTGPCAAEEALQCNHRGGGGAIGSTLARLLLDDNDGRGGDGLVLEQRCCTNAIF